MGVTWSRAVVAARIRKEKERSFDVAGSDRPADPPVRVSHATLGLGWASCSRDGKASVVFDSDPTPRVLLWRFLSRV